VVFSEVAGMKKSQTTISNQIRRLRFEAGEMTQQALAEQVGVTRQTIIAIEGGRYSPSLEVAFRIAAVFGVGLNDVFSYEPPDAVSS
jgi:putative transcriptional regulator